MNPIVKQGGYPMVPSGQSEVLTEEHAGFAKLHVSVLPRDSRAESARPFAY